MKIIPIDLFPVGIILSPHPPGTNTSAGRCGDLLIMNHNQVIGQLGERLAEGFLDRRGYRVLDRNVKTSFKELDLIVMKDGVLVFVEVKTRTNFSFGGAEETMTRKKISNLKQAALLYLNRKKINYKVLRFDFLAVDYNQATKTANIKHYQDII